MFQNGQTRFKNLAANARLGHYTFGTLYIKGLVAHFFLSFRIRKGGKTCCKLTMV